jgi:serine/threonine protein kinase
VQGTFDEDGLKMSEKGMEDGEQLFQLHDFDKVKHLGSGAQGVVNEVVHKVSGEHYAMKVQQLQQEESVRRKQVLELRTLRKSRHPSVVTLYDAFYSEG